MEKMAEMAEMAEMEKWKNGRMVKFAQLAEMEKGGETEVRNGEMEEPFRREIQV